MTLTEIKLPLWALRQADACFPEERITDFKANHGHPPGDDSTLAEWWAVTPDLSARLGDVTCALPLVYPDRRRDLLRAVVQFAYQVARRTQPYFAADPAPRKALALTRRWLAGKDVAGAKLWDVSVDAAAEAARGNISARIAASAATYATYAAYAADAAIAADADAFNVGYHAHAYPVVPTAPHNQSQPCIEVKMSKSSQHHGGQAAPAVTLSVLPKSGRPRTEPPEWQRKKRQHHIGLKNSRRPLAAFQDLAACWLRATGGWTPVLPVKSC